MAEFYSNSLRTILLLFFTLLVLIVLLIFLYKKLNKEANEKYTIRHMVFKKGGIRDQVRAVAVSLGTRFGIQLLPRNDVDDYGEEMHEVHNEEEEVEEGDSCMGKDPESDEEAQEEKGDQNGVINEKIEKTSVDSSSVENEEDMEQDIPAEKPEKKEEKVGEERCQREGAGLLIDLKQFSGSATWSSEEGGEKNVTAL